MKLRYSEAFYSVQGEGRFVGVPSVFLRVFGCNFECAGFGQPRGELIATESMPYNTDPRADKDHPEAYKSIDDLPVTLLGCDSSASWSKKYKHLQMTKSVDEVFDHITSLLPNGTFTGQHGEDIHLVITGGEPLLGWQRVWPELLDMCRQIGLVNVTFETNGTQPLTDEFIEFFKRYDGELFFSVSPKLWTVAGEKAKRAIKPEVIAQYNNSFPILDSNVYTTGQLKFVVGPKEEQWEEMEQVISLLKEQGVNWPVWIMPVGATVEGQKLVDGDVAKMAYQRGYNVSARVHTYLWGNVVGV